MSNDNKKYIRVTNISGQMIALQIKPPGGDTLIDERQARLNPTKSITVPQSYLLPAQIENLKARRQIQTAFVE